MANRRKKNLSENEINNLINEADYINKIYQENINNLDNKYIINIKDKKIAYFIFKNLSGTLKQFLRFNKNKIICKENKSDKTNYLTKNLSSNINIFISNFINLCIINYQKLSQYFRISDSFMLYKILKISKIFFLNDIINEDGLKLILGLQIYLCAYNKDKKSQKIEKEEKIYLVIDFLSKFCQAKYYQLTDGKINQINSVIKLILDFLKNKILKNFSDVYLLSRNKSFFKLIELCQITSYVETRNILSILVEVYKYKLNIDFVFNDLSNQFLYKIDKDSLLNKLKLLITKNKFLNNIFEKETSLIKGEIIKNGFYFSDFPLNGIQCEPKNKFPNEKDGYSIVISFKLMEKNNTNKYTIFSFKNKENKIMSVFIEGGILKIKMKKDKKDFELNEKISIDKYYILWIIQTKSKKHKMTILLNETKTIFNSVSSYPEGNYKINFGCEVNKDNISVDNFVGIIGTFILFNKCLIKEENDTKNITKLQNNLIQLKANYEDILYNDCNKEWAFIDKDINHILHSISNDIKKNEDIELVISSKSLGNDNLIYKSQSIISDFEEGIYCNYFQNSSMTKNDPKFYFRDKNFLKNNKNFPIYTNNSFFDFLNGHGLSYLQLELYYLIGMVSLKLENENSYNQNNNIKIFDNANKEEEFYTQLTNICTIFFTFIDSFNSSIYFNDKQIEIFRKEIMNFKYTLIDLVSILCKNNCKIKIYFLMLFCLKMKDKKYLDFSSFVLNYEFHDSNDNQILKTILSELMNIIKEDDCDNSQIQIFFLKLIEYDKIYTNEKIEKRNQNDYSKLIRLLLRKSLNENIIECLKEYKKKLKQLVEDFSKNILYDNNISNIQEEEYYNGNDKPSNKLSVDSTNINENNNIVSSRKESYNRKESIQSNIIKEKNNDKNLHYLILIYKYLKNLYISINENKNKYLDLFEGKKEEYSSFFNELFDILERVYPIQANYNEKDSNPLIYVEYIKCLCIRFLDDCFFEDNYKIIKEEEDKLKNKGEELEDFDNRSTDNLKKSNNSCKTLLNPKQSYIKGNIKGSFVSGSSIEYLSLKNLNTNNNSRHASFISNFNIANNTIEEVLTSQMEFFNEFILSPYTFRSVFLMLFRNYTNEDKIKLIKGKKEKKFDFTLEIKDFNKIRYLLKVILFVIERLNSDEIDTCFMNKRQLIEYIFTILSEMIKKNLENYLKKDKLQRKKEKSMIKSLFMSKKSDCFVARFYKIMISCILSINESKDDLLIKLENEMKDIIKNSLFELKDPFYFKTLREIFFENSDLNELVFNLEIFIMENLASKFVKNEKNNIIEINCKNELILLYQTIFFVNKRYYILENNLFIKTIFAFISEVVDHSSIIYLKILFPIEATRGKLLFEIIFEIIIELYIESLRNPKYQSLQVVIALLKGLFTENKLKSNLGAYLKHFSIFKDIEDKEEDFTPFYIMDLISDFNYSEITKNGVKIEKNIFINKYYFDLRKKIIKRYKEEIKSNYNIFSSCILFSIKIILAIKELYEFYSSNKSSISPATSFNSESNNNEEKNKDSVDNNSNSNDDLFISELTTQFINLSKNIQRIHKDYININPFKSAGYYSKNIYEHFRSFIIDNIDFNNDDYMNKIYELIENINTYNRDLKFFMRVIYNEDGRTRLYNEKNYKQIIKSLSSEKAKTIIIDKDSKQSIESIDSISDIKSSNNNSSNSVKFNLKSTDFDHGFDSRKSFNKDIFRNDIYLNFNNSHSQKQLFKKPDLLNKINFDGKDNKIIYKSRIKFKKDLIRTYFSSFFTKLLTYDEDYINMKRLYTIAYNKEIENIDKYKISYPTRIKNYICNNYDKIFLKRDFDFFTDGYFKYSHKYLFKKNNSNKNDFKLKNKFIFPNKRLLLDNDCIDKDLFSKNIINKITIYDCELIMTKGSIFGNIFIFNNCLLFKSDINNDKRKVLNKSEKDYEIGALYACCSLEYDFLKKEKKILIEYNNIKEIINRTYVYNWIAFEIFLKDGRSFYFNLFNEETLSDFFETIKIYKIPIIKKPNEFFKKEEFCKKWKEEKITTYDYLLLLNKYSSRTYNDTNQYLVMPWLFLVEGIKHIRNFDLPISVQDEITQKNFLGKVDSYLKNSEALSHGNHYSTLAYLCFYLMRANPFTNIMIKFQSNNFDVPERQYTDIKNTMILCQELENNRELVPEIFSIPEIYMNLNDNDFGQQKTGYRAHNLSFEPYAKDPFQFCYILKDLMNNNHDINEHINKWFDFIFGVNQLGNFSSNKNMSFEEREKYRCLRKFNNDCYGKLFNFKKIYAEAKKHSKSFKSFYEEIRAYINLVNSFGQCPYQLLNEIHPSKNKYNSNSAHLQKSNLEYETNIFDEDSSSYKNDIHNLMNYNKNIEDIKIPKGQNEIIYFSKSSNNNFLYCLLNNGIINIYKFDTKIKKNFILEKEVKLKCQFLSLKKTKSNVPIFQSKYHFCELNENSFIIGRTLNKTLIHYNFVEDFETSFLLKSYIISILNIKNNEFITGNDNGYLCKWKININNKENKVDIELILMVKAVQNSITSLYYDEKLNIIVSTDINTLTIRKGYDFEYLNSIQIKNKENKYITDIKINDYNFLYLLIYCEDKNIYEIQGYTLNGTYFGKHVGMISNFEISKTGKLLVNEEDNKGLLIKVLDPVNFNEVNYKEIFTKRASDTFHFYFERPNIIYYGIKDDEYTRIKIIFLHSGDRNIFYIDDAC